VVWSGRVGLGTARQGRGFTVLISSRARPGEIRYGGVGLGGVWYGKGKSLSIRG